MNPQLTSQTPNAAVSGSTAHIPPGDSATWLGSMPSKMAQYAGVLARYGFETTFAMGFIDGATELVTYGVWGDDAQLLAAQLPHARTLVARWTPIIAALPTNGSVVAWLANLPVPALARYADSLASAGFDSLAALKCILLEDAQACGLVEGHARALCHCVFSMSLPSYEPPSPTIDLRTWLGFLRPSLSHYFATLELDGYRTVQDLWKMKKGDLSQLLMSRGHARVLWHYILVSRTSGTIRCDST